MNAIQPKPTLPKRYQEVNRLYMAFTSFIGQNPTPCTVSFYDVSFTVTPEYVKVLKASELAVKPDPPQEANLKNRKTPLTVALVCNEGTLAFTYYPEQTTILQTTDSLRIVYPSYTVTLQKQL